MKLEIRKRNNALSRAYLRDRVVQRKGFRVVCIIDGVCMQIYGRYRRNGLNGRGVWPWGSVCQVGGGARARHYDGVGDGVGMELVRLQ